MIVLRLSIAVVGTSAFWIDLAGQLIKAPPGRLRHATPEAITPEILCARTSGRSMGGRRVEQFDFEDVTAIPDLEEHSGHFPTIDRVSQKQPLPRREDPNLPHLRRWASVDLNARAFQTTNRHGSAWQHVVRRITLATPELYTEL